MFVPDEAPVITTLASVVDVGALETFTEVLSVFALLVAAALEVARLVVLVAAAAAAAADVRFGNSVVAAAAVAVLADAAFWAKAVEESRPVVSRVESSTAATGWLRKSCIVFDMLAHSRL